MSRENCHAKSQSLLPDVELPTKMLSSVASAKNEHRHYCHQSEKYSNERKKAPLRRKEQKKKRKMFSRHWSRRAMASPDDHDSFRAATKRRIIDDMLGKVAASGGGEWKVLIVDPVTVPVVSASCGMSDLTNEGVSLVENLAQSREPQRHLDAVYFISPSLTSLQALCADFADQDEERRLYARAHVFFSSPISPAHLATLKQCRGLVRSLASLAELNLEYHTKDTHTFTTGQPGVMQAFFASDERAREGEAQSASAAAETAATRVATLLASLGEFPTIRYKDRGVDGAAGTSPAANVAQRLYRMMLALRNRQGVSGETGGVPRFGSTCDVLVLDRACDPVAPLAREWTYEAMVFDLLDVSPLGVYAYEIETNAGTQKKQAVLGESDPLFVELRHEHIAFVLNALAEKAKAFSDAGGGRLDADASTGSLKRAVESLPRFMEAQAKLSVHTSIAARLNAMLKKHGLGDVGRVEERVIFGEATSKDVVALFNEFAAAGASGGDGFRAKVGKGHGRRGRRGQEPVRGPERRLGLGKDVRHASGGQAAASPAVRGVAPREVRRRREGALEQGFRLESGGRRDGVVAGAAGREGLEAQGWEPRRGGRERRVQDHQGEAADGARAQERVGPVPVPAGGARAGATDRRADAAAGRVPRAGGGRRRTSARRRAPCRVVPRAARGRAARPKPRASPRAQRAPARRGRRSIANRARAARRWGATPSFRSAAARGASPAWGWTTRVTRVRASTGTSGQGSVIPPRRLIVFVVGGVTRGEMREAHALSRELGREVLIGGTEVLTPETFMGELARLGGGFSGAIARNDEEVDLDDIVIE
jgi:syntaxin-binding protein 1